MPKGRKLICRNCDGKWSDYYGDGYPCDQCQYGYQYPDEYSDEDIESA